MNDEHWAAIEFRLESARVLLQDAASDIPGTGMRFSQQQAIAASVESVYISPEWERKFYAHLDAFLALARSIPDVIQTCFGADPGRRGPIKAWFATLDIAEQTRRTNFQAEFGVLYAKFSKLNLSKARISTLHWGGAAPVEVKLRGRWGDLYVGGPFKSLPILEIPHTPGSDHIVAGDDAGLQFAATEPSRPLPLKQTDFNFVIYRGNRRIKKPLFDQCRLYLKRAERLITKARRISRKVHGSQSLQRPPSIL